MPSPRISFVSLLLAPLALLSAACVHTGGHPAAAAATPAAPAPVASPPAAASAASPPPSPAAPDFANPPAASSASPANGRPGAAASSAGSGAARYAPAKQPAPKTPAAQRPQPPAAAPSAPAAATAAAAKPATPAAAALDLNGLEQRLRDTRAIGVFTKLSLKNQVDDLLTEFRTYHQGRTPPTLMQLRQQYEVLLMKVVTLLQDGDPSLAGAVVSSREAIWGVLTDPVKFANI
ncbi:MAG TPA: hypothetical protein VET66_01035 [Steroidobacteraceae bacterium]|nr:hypothetical protein [Steroidobacteraceae bacterium]